jgi:hypothetical protein
MTGETHKFYQGQSKCHLSCMNARQAKFVAGILSGKSQRKAYVAAGYKSRGKNADEAAARLAALPEVAAALGQAEARIVEAAVELRIADSPYLLRRLMAFAELKDDKGKDRVSVQFAAIKLLGDNLGTWTAKPEKPPSPIDLSQLTDAAKRSLLAALRALVATPAIT